MAVDWSGATDSNVVDAGVTTLRWGTGGLLSANLKKAIVESADEETDVEKIYVEQGDGMRATRFLLIQGRTYNFTVVDDNTVFTSGSPNVGQNVSVVDMLSTGASQVKAYGTYVAQRVNAGRKVEGKRVMTLENMVLIDTQGAGGSLPY
jgi:hypothetical protein